MKMENRSQTSRLPAIHPAYWCALIVLPLAFEVKRRNDLPQVMQAKEKLGFGVQMQNSLV